MTYKYYGEELEHGLFRRQKTQHKYIKREWKNGKWLYTYAKPWTDSNGKTHMAYGHEFKTTGQVVKDAARSAVGTAKAKSVSAYNKTKNTVISTAKKVKNTTTSKVNKVVNSAKNHANENTTTTTYPSNTKRKYKSVSSKAKVRK